MGSWTNLLRRTLGINTIRKDDMCSSTCEHFEHCEHRFFYTINVNKFSLKSEKCKMLKCPVAFDLQSLKACCGQTLKTTQRLSRIKPTFGVSSH